MKVAVFIPGSDSERAGEAIKESLADEDWELELINMGHLEAVSALQAKKVDLAIISNDISLSTKGIRTITPLYLEAFLSLVKADHPLSKVKSFEVIQQMIKDQRPKILFSYRDSYDHLFAVRTLEQRGIYPEHYDAIYLPLVEDFEGDILSFVAKESPDIIFTIATLDSHIIKAALENGYIIRNTEDIDENIENEYISSYALQNVRAVPMVVPAYNFGSAQKEPYVTLGLTTVLAVRKSMGDYKVANLTRDLFSSIPSLTRLNPNFVEMREDFDRLKIHFKLHSGAISYYERDVPGFFERYAEMSGVIFSMTVVLLGTLATIRRSRAQRKKDRIDKYYLDILQARKDPDTKHALDRLLKIEERALNQLVDEKLAADEAFVVLMQLLDSSRRRIKNPDEKDS